MRRLWLADVHANWPAFQAVLADAGPVDEVLFLGDIVGYGPHPAACVDRLRDLGARAVRGNHDVAILARPADAPSAPGDWDAWTRAQLDPAQLDFLTALPEAFRLEAWGTQVAVRHQPPGAPYLHPAMPDALLAGHFAAVDAPAVCCGHSHRALDRTIGGRRLVLLPAVGQPRDGDPRAGYALEQDGALTFRAVPYDVERVVADLAHVDLDETFRERWRQFVRTGFDAEWSRPYTPATEAEG